MICVRPYCDNKAMWPPYDVCELCAEAFELGEWDDVVK